MLMGPKRDQARALLQLFLQEVVFVEATLKDLFHNMARTCLRWLEDRSKEGNLPWISVPGIEIPGVSMVNPL